MREKFKAYYIELVKDKRKRALDALFSFFLLLVSSGYGFLLKIISSCYVTGVLKTFKPACRVISVGNLTWGGTGKTPLVETLARFFQQKGKKPAILIRGYGEDELYLLKEKLNGIPVLGGVDRVKTAKEALVQYGADMIILDDGFQYWRLSRDCDIVLIDATYPFGNRKLIPRGILREPFSSLNRANIFVLTKTDLVEPNKIEFINKELRRYNHKAPIYKARHRPVSLRNLVSEEKLELAKIESQRIASLSGIGSPQSFENTLTLLGAKTSVRFNFPDHYRYSKKDLERIERQCLKKQIEILVTTEKDALKLVPLLKSMQLSIKVWVLCIEFEIVGDEESFFLSLQGIEDPASPYSILILSDTKAGHLNQARAVAGLIEKRKKEQGIIIDSEINTKVAEVKFKNRFCRILLDLCSIFSGEHCRRCLLCLKFCLEKESFNELIQIPAQIIVSAGSTLSAVNLFLTYKNSARNIILMKPPFLSLSRFDLVIAPEHDRLKPGANVLVTRITPNLIDQQYLQEQAEILNTRYEIRDTRYENKGPTIGLLIGGDTPKLKLSLELMEKLSFQLKQAAECFNCQILLTTSRRTPKVIEQLLKDKFTNFPNCKLLVIANEKNIPEAVGGILGLSDILVVSGESISMVSEAASAEKYLLSFRPEKKAPTLTKQEIFLEKLENEGVLKIVNPENLHSEIEKFCKVRPIQNKINDRELIYQRLSKIV